MEAATLGEQGKHAEAVELMLPLIDKNPDDVDALFILGFSFLMSERPGLGYQVIKRAAELRPSEAGIWHNLGKACYDMLDLEGAEKYWRQALKLKPNHVNSLDGMGLIHLRKNEHGLCIEYCNRALLAAPDTMDSTVNRSMSYLALGRWKEGWQGYNANIGKNKDRQERIYGKETRWNGEKGKRIVCYGEQGIGDEISFASCLPDLIRDSASVVIETDMRLKGVFQRAFPQCKVFGTRYEKTITWQAEYEFDHRVALGQLPQFYRNHESEFPGTPYLNANEEMALQWRALLKSLGDKPKIGLAWTGGRPHTGRDRRSVTLKTLAPILALDADFVSLQYEYPDEIDTSDVKIHHWKWGVQAHDFDQTMALISELDAVVSVTTTAVHAAGALGVSCYCLVPSKVMWRYPVNGAKFPWANSVQMFRQKGKDWPVFQIAEQLREKFDKRQKAA